MAGELSSMPHLFVPFVDIFPPSLMPCPAHSTRMDEELSWLTPTGMLLEHYHRAFNRAEAEEYSGITLDKV